MSHNKTELNGNNINHKEESKANEKSIDETGTLLVHQNIEILKAKKLKAEKSKNDVPPDVPYFKLFRYASTSDMCLIFLAILSTALTGCVLPFNTIVFADLLNAMVTYGKITGIMEAANDTYSPGINNTAKDILNNSMYSLYVGMTPEIESTFKNEVLWFAIYNVLLGVVLLVFSYTAVIFMNRAAFNQIYRIRKEYMKAALNQDFAYYDLHESGDFASKMSDDIVKLEDSLGEKVVLFLHYIFSFISSVSMALIRGWELALVCLTSFPVTLILVGSVGFVAAKLAKKEAVAYGKAGAVAEEVLSSIRTVLAFDGQEKEVHRFQEKLIEAKKINIKRSYFTGGAMGVLFLCIYCTYALSFWYGVRLLLSNSHYDPSTMISVFFGVLMGTMNFGIATSLIEIFGIGKGAGAQIFNLIDNVPNINPLLDRGVKPPIVQGNIELKDVHFTYPSRSDVPVLRGISLKILRGQTVALVGASGCGKSTIIQLIARFYDTAQGSVLLDDNNVRDLSVNWLRSQIGLVGQEPVLFNTTIYENIRYGREDATKEEIEAAAKAANAHHFITALPKGYDMLVGDKGTQLSGGQKQRIAIARALLRNPQILLLDEATSALDNKSEARVQVALDKAREGRTTVIVAHRLSTIRNVDIIYALKDGQVVEHGSHQQLLEKKGLYYAMVMLQTIPDNDLMQPGKDLIQRQESIISAEFEDDGKEAPEVLKDENSSEVIEKVPLRKVMALSKPETKLIAVACICCAIQGFSMPIFSVIFGDFIGVLSSQDADLINSQTNTYSLIFVGIGICTGIVTFINVTLFGIAGEHLTERLRRQMLSAILRQEVGFFDDKKNSTGALCAKLSGEASYVQGATGQRIGTVLQAVATLSLALVLAMYYEYRVGLLSLAFTPFIIFMIYKQITIATKESFGTANTMESSTKLAVDAVSNIRTVASLGRERIFLEKYKEELLPGLYLARRGTHIRGVVFGVSRSIVNFAFAAAMYYGGFLIVQEGVHYENVIKTAQALIMSTTTVANAFAYAPNFQKGLNAAQRIIALLNREPKVKDPVTPVVDVFDANGEAEFNEVHFSYPSRRTVSVLRGLNLSVMQGKTIALVGQSGCGKSTCIQLLERYYDPDSGVVSLDKVNVKDVNLSELRKNIGIVQQEPILFDRTISDNIAYGDNSRQATQEEIINAAKQSNIHTFVASLPLGYNTRLGSKGTQLSGGQKQRIAIARALLRNPKLLLLDEATSALDVESEKIVQDALDKAKEGRTCITIAHRLSTIQDADAICVFHEGRICEMGTHSQLMAKGGLYYSLQKHG